MMKDLKSNKNDLEKQAWFPKVNSNERMIGTLDKTVCQGESKIKRVLKMFRLCCRSCVFKGLKDSRLTARFSMATNIPIYLPFYRVGPFISFHYDLQFLSLPASSKCSPASEVRWHLFEMANPEVGRETCCNFRWSNCNVPPESLWSKRCFDDLAMFWIVLKCFPEPDSCRHVQFAFVPRFVPGNVCLKRSTNPSLLFYLNPCMKL